MSDFKCGEISLSQSIPGVFIKRNPAQWLKSVPVEQIHTIRMKDHAKWPSSMDSLKAKVHRSFSSSVYWQGNSEFKFASNTVIFDEALSLQQKQGLGADVACTRLIEIIPAMMSGESTTHPDMGAMKG